MEYVPCNPETCAMDCEKCNMMHEDLDMMSSEIELLEDRLNQIKSISLIARRSLEETLACDCCAESVLEGIFSAIEAIAAPQVDM